VSWAEAQQNGFKNKQRFLASYRNLEAAGFIRRARKVKALSGCFTAQLWLLIDQVSKENLEEKPGFEINVDQVPKSTLLGGNQVSKENLDQVTGQNPLTDEDKTYKKKDKEQMSNAIEDDFDLYIQERFTKSRKLQEDIINYHKQFINGKSIS
ncbi:MAG: hypothetical protein ACREQ5_10675, partial [Candidatus Dormibacteria bacterium]